MAATRPVEGLIHVIRGQKVMRDSDLAVLYEVTTSALNQTVRRNLERFPADFMFQLTDEEVEILRSQNVISSSVAPKHGGRRFAPYVFTEHGVAMLASVLRSRASDPHRPFHRPRLYSDARGAGIARGDGGAH